MRLLLAFVDGKTGNPLVKEPVSPCLRKQQEPEDLKRRFWVEPFLQTYRLEPAVTTFWRRGVWLASKNKNRFLDD